MEKIIVQGEPQEVTEIRDKILNSFNELIFVEDGHKYFLRGEELQSVSNVTHQFEPQSDWDAIATNYALKHGETKKYWQDQWRYNSLKATIRGTLTHEYGESMAWLRNGFPERICPSCVCKHVDNWLVPTHPKEEAILKFWDELPPNLHFVLAETKVYSGVNPNLPKLNKNYAGTFDLLFYYKDPIDDSKSGLVICDYKGLPLDTPILTTNGWKTMGVIQEGDYVFDKNGNPTKVLHTSSIHHNPCYKIKFDNDEIIADCDHRWEISFIKEGRITNKVMTTLEIKEYLDGLKKRYSHLIPKIMITKPLENDKKELPIDPYVLGLWLGDGSKQCGVITNMFEEVWEEIKRRGYELGKDVSQGSSRKATMRTVLGLSKELRKLNLLNNKHIPELFLLSSIEQRKELLRGIMDSDGYYNKTRKRFVINTTQIWQKESCVQLLSSLGIKSTVIKTYAIYNKNNGEKEKRDTFHITFWCDFNPFLVKKYDIEKPLKNKHIFRNIVSVEEVEIVPTRCIEVESETHTFCCGYNMLVTHNTNKELIKDFSRAKDKMLLHPFENLYDEAQSLYTLQLSCYQIPLEDIGLKVIGRRLIHLKDDGTYEKIALPNVTKELRNTL
jgi:hypothetical protein